MVVTNLNQFMLTFPDGTAHLIASMLLHQLWLPLLQYMEKISQGERFGKYYAMIRVTLGTAGLSQRKAFFKWVGLPRCSQHGMKYAPCGDKLLDLHSSRQVPARVTDEQRNPG